MHTKPDEQNQSSSNGAANETPVNQNATAEENPKVESVTVSPEEQVKEAQVKAKEYLDGWQRERAEFANFRRRIDKEREELSQSAAVEVLGKFLPVLDDFDLAIANVPADQVNEEVMKGFQMIHRKLVGLLDNAGVKVINPMGEPFDPTQHEALGQDPAGDLPAGHISAVLRKGYSYGNKVLRAALVRVAG
jgi:molecular chaperone GrpE